jgi:hypothetical protein
VERNIVIPAKGVRVGCLMYCFDHWREVLDVIVHRYLIIINVKFPEQESLRSIRLPYDLQVTLKEE